MIHGNLTKGQLERLGLGHFASGEDPIPPSGISENDVIRMALSCYSDERGRFMEEEERVILRRLIARYQANRIR